MTESDQPIQDLKRKRPKTHLVWYIGGITAFLAIGVSIAYAMQQPNQASKSKDTTRTPIFAVNLTTKVKHSNLPLKQQITQPVKVNPSESQTPVTESETPIYSSISTKTEQVTSQQPTHTIEQKKPIAITKTKPRKSHSQTKPNQDEKHNQNQHTETPPAETPGPPKETTPVPPSSPNNHKGPIIQIVDRLTNTVSYLLTGKTKN